MMVQTSFLLFYSSVCVSVAEVCSKRHRAMFGAVWNGVFALGSCMVAAVAYFVRDFVKLQHCFTWPNFIIFLFVL